MADAQGPGIPPPPPGYPYPYGVPLPPYAPPRSGRPASFYLALLFGVMLIGSIMANLFLLLVAFSAVAVRGGSESIGGEFRETTRSGDPASRKKILLVPIHGLIFDDDVGGGFAPAEGTVSVVRRRLRAAMKDPDVAGVILEIDSPGGGVTASDLIHREITTFRSGKHVPVAAVMKDVAASGGYYAAVATDRIFAHPTTITGSIGVIMQLLNYGELLEKVGLKEVTIIPRETPFKDMGSPTRPMRPEEREKFDSLVEAMYERFVGVVKDGRPKLTLERVRELANGSVMTGTQALDAGLVDEVGYLEQALEWVRQSSGETLARLVEWQRPPSIVESLFGASAPAPDRQASMGPLLAAALRDPAILAGSGPRLLYLWTGAGSGR